MLPDPAAPVVGVFNREPMYGAGSTQPVKTTAAATKIKMENKGQPCVVGSRDGFGPCLAVLIWFARLPTARTDLRMLRHPCGMGALQSPFLPQESEPQK